MNTLVKSGVYFAVRWIFRFLWTIIFSNGSLIMSKVPSKSSCLHVNERDMGLAHIHGPEICLLLPSRSSVFCIFSTAGPSVSSSLS